ncbi:MAG: Holliday junction resolvase RecU [Bacilli bacterium]|nr:Holliday junction resolvase RecU [Bacilli bacterium]
MAVNRGKQFEQVIRESFNRVPNTNVTRLADDMGGFKGKSQPCDFLIFHSPYLYAIECKSVHGNTFPLSNITDNQWKGLQEMSTVNRVIAGVMIWFIDKDVTTFYSIKALKWFKEQGAKSIRFSDELFGITIRMQGKKKRVFFEYDAEQFFREAEQ